MTQTELARFVSYCQHLHEEGPENNADAWPADREFVKEKVTSSSDRCFSTTINKDKHEMVFAIFGLPPGADDLLVARLCAKINKLNAEREKYEQRTEVPCRYVAVEYLPETEEYEVRFFDQEYDDDTAQDWKEIISLGE